MTDGIELYDPRLDPKNREAFGEEVNTQGRNPMFAAQMVKISLRVPRECLIAAENLSNEMNREYGKNVQMAVFFKGRHDTGIWGQGARTHQGDGR